MRQEIQHLHTVTRTTNDTVYKQKTFQRVYIRLPMLVGFDLTQTVIDFNDNLFMFEHSFSVAGKSLADKDNGLSTDLFLKGLHLSFFESNDLHQDDYQRHERPEYTVRKRKSPTGLANFPTMQKKKLVVDFSKSTPYNETKDHHQTNANKTDTLTDTKLIETTMTSASQANTTHAPLNSTKQPFLIQVY